MRRLNVKLTLWLVGITLFSVVAVHLLHGYQIDRNAEFLHLQAQAAEKNGDAKQAITQYNQYLKYRDDPVAYSALAGLVVQIAQETDATRKDRVKAYSTLEIAIRRHPDLDDVRRRLIDYTMTMGRFPEALEHIQYLVEAGKSDSGLEVKAARCLLQNGEEDKALKKLYALVGFDEQTGQFKAEANAAAKEVDAFEALAAVLGRKSDGRKRADEVMTQLVTLNPELAKAHLVRSNYLAMNSTVASRAAAIARTDSERATADEEAKKLLEESRQEMEKAFELSPDDVDALLAKSAFSANDRDFAGAQELLDKALQQDPKRQETYVRLAQLDITQSNPKLAAEHLQRGLQLAADTQSILQLLVEVQFQLDDLDGVRSTCKSMREKGTFVPEFISFQEARIAVAEGDYTEAARGLESVRPALSRSGFSNYVAQLDLLLSRCYEILGQPDRQLEVCRRILKVYPDQVGARVGETTALQSLGRYQEAAPNLQMFAANLQQLKFLRGALFQFFVADQLSKPEDERDWTHAEAAAELMYEDKERSELDNGLLKAELAMLKNDLDQAQQILTPLRKENPKEVKVWIALVKLFQRQKATNKIPQLLNFAEKEVGDVPALRLERINQIARQPGDDAAAELAKLEVNLDKFSEREQNTLLLSLGSAYLAVRDLDNARRCWTVVAERQPRNGQLRQTIFDLAVDMKDQAGMQAMVKSIADSKEFGPQSPLYDYCAAASMMFPLTYRNRATAGPLTTADRGVIAEARRLLDEAIAGRAEWSPLWRVRAEIEQVEGNLAGAIANYQRALDSSKINQAASARRLVQLLYMSRRYAEAGDALKYVGTVGPSDVLSKIKEDIQIRSGKKEDIEDALALAKRAAEEEPDKPSNHTWYGICLARAGQSDEAEQAFRQAVAVGDKLPETWDALVKHLLASKKKAEAVEAVRQASSALTENPTAVAWLYERVGDQAQAEGHYKEALDEHPDDIPALRNIAEYYIRTKQPTEANAYLDQIINQTAQSTDQQEIMQLCWARRYKAQSMATPRTPQEPPSYEQVVQATNLIEQNAQNGALSPEDIRVIVGLLANRPEPESRNKAVQLLEQLRRRNLMTAREEMALGQLRERTGEWEEARKTMFSALSRSSEDPEILVPLSQLLVHHKEYDEAGRWVEKLDELLANMTLPRADVLKATTRELKARILVQKNEPEKAIRVLEGLVPNPVPQNQLYLLEKIAVLLEDLGLNKAAEKLLNDYMTLEPRGTIAMAAYKGRQGDVEQAFTLLEEARKNQPAVEILPVAFDTLRRHPDKATKERFATLEEWTNTALQAESNSQQVQLLAAELYDLEARYPEVLKIYRDLLKNSQANETQKAIVKNNLAFVIAITQNAPDSTGEGLALTNEAMRILGPNSDLLDTRGLVYLAQGDVKKAIADLEAAATDPPASTAAPHSQASKYFHLAEAQQRAKLVDAARESMKKAEELGLDLTRFTPLEKQNYARLVEELK